MGLARPIYPIYTRFIFPVSSSDLAFISDRGVLNIVRVGPGRVHACFPVHACRPEEITMLDVVYIVIGIAAFVATALYLPACDSL